MPTTERFATTTEAKYTRTRPTTVVTPPKESSPTSIDNMEYTNQQTSTEKTSTQVSDDNEFKSLQTYSEGTMFTSENAVSVTAIGHTIGKYSTIISFLTMLR